MPRAASARRGERSRRTAAPANAIKPAKSVKAIAKHAPSSRSANRSAKPAGKGNAQGRAAAKPLARGGRGSSPGDRRALEKVVQGGRASVARADTGVGASRGKYVYCIIESGAPLHFGSIGIGADPSDVYTVHYRNLAAVVSDAPLEVFDSTRENVLAHERVNETVMREHTVIPMSFGTIFKTREDIVELLRSAYEAFADVLNKMQDKLEFGLKVLWDRDDMVRVIEQEDEDIHRLKSEISSQKGSTYFARMQYGRLIDGALQQRSERYVAEFLQRLRDVSVASRVNRAIGDKMIMNAAFLVQRDQEPAFDRRIKEIAATFDKLTFKYTGPWPPYNFVNIRLKLERAGQH